VSSALRDGSVASARCGTQADGSTVKSAVALGCEMRSRRLAACVAITSQVGDEMLDGSTAGPHPLVRRRDVGVKRRYCLLDRHRQSYSFWLSPTNYFLQYRGWLSILDVLVLTCPS